jgi:hypothetical protein
MVRKAAWLLLLVLVANIQVFATVCATRCALMSIPTRTVSIDRAAPGMEHCSGTMIAPAGSGSGVGQFLALQGCSHDICRQDLSATRDHIAVDKTDVVLRDLASASVTAPAVDSPVLLDQSWRSPAEQRTALPSNLVPLISNLRV